MSNRSELDLITEMYYDHMCLIANMINNNIDHSTIVKVIEKKIYNIKEFRSENNLNEYKTL